MQQQHEEWLTRADIMRELRRSSDTITRWIRTGTLPKPERAATKQAQQWRRSTLRKHGVL